MTPSEFKASFPDGEFSSLADNYVQVFLTAAVPFFDVSRWGAFYSEGLACYVANSIVVSKARAAMMTANPGAMDAGDVTSQSVGDVSFSQDGRLLARQMADVSQRTQYGQRYAQLRRLIGAGGTAV
jgi:hypothetical protein